MEIELRDYQGDLIHELSQRLKIHRSCVLQSSPGSGKTVMAAHMIQESLKKNVPTKFICHRKELISQTHKTMDKYGIDYGIIQAGIKPDYKNPFQICSISTLKNRLDCVGKKGIVIWDECHHLGSKMYLEVMAAFPDAIHIGLTGTPERLDGTGLRGAFNFMVQGPQTKWLIENGHLSDFIYYSPDSPDTSDVPNQAGDYKIDGLGQVFNRPTIVGSVIEHWKKHAYGLRTLVFACSIKHSMYIVQRFNDAGIPAIHLDGKTHPSLRTQGAEMLAEGHVSIISNVNLFGEGYDLAAQIQRDCTIQAVILARKTQSLGFFLQMSMRALRPQSERSVILDCVGNSKIHGWPDDDREWTLEGEKRTKKSILAREIQARKCPKCFGDHRLVAICPYCGHVYEIQARQPEEVAGELTKVDREKEREKRSAILKQARRKCKTLEDLKKFGADAGYKKGWALHFWNATGKYRSKTNAM